MSFLVHMAKSVRGGRPRPPRSLNNVETAGVSTYDSTSERGGRLCPPRFPATVNISEPLGCAITLGQVGRAGQFKRWAGDKQIVDQHSDVANGDVVTCGGAATGLVDIAFTEAQDNPVAAAGYEFRVY